MSTWPTIAFATHSYAAVLRALRSEGISSASSSLKVIRGDGDLAYTCEYLGT